MYKCIHCCPNSKVKTLKLYFPKQFSHVAVSLLTFNAVYEKDIS